MLEGGLLLQTFSFYQGGQFGGLIDSLTQIGFFSFVLPFLLLFALIYGILLKVKIFDKNAINGIIALAVALIALQFDIVPQFFSEIFPQLGIGLAVILVILIIMGLFMPNYGWVGYLLFGVSTLIIIIILYQSFGGANLEAISWIKNYLPFIIGIIFIIIIIAFLTRERTAPIHKLGDVLPFLGYPRT